MATSFELPVCSRLPWVWMRSVATGRTPEPICRPAGSTFCMSLRPPAWRMFWYSRSWNTARDFLNPLVLTFARLLAITSILVCCASRPVLAVQSDLIIGYSSKFSAERQQPVGLACVVFAGLHGLHLHFVHARGGDHVDHGFHRADVAAFQCPGLQARVVVGRQRRGIAVGIERTEQAVVATRERLLVGRDQLQLADLHQRVGFVARTDRADGAVGADG